VDKCDRQPLFQVGDFVKCWYSMHQFYYAAYADDFELEPKHGIIVEVDYAEYDSDWFFDIIYVVYCTDGMYRFFTEEEVYKIA